MLKILGSVRAETLSSLQKRISLVRGQVQSWRTSRCDNTHRNGINRDCSLPQAIALASMTATLMMGLAQLGFFQAMELKTFDRLTQLMAYYQRQYPAQSITDSPADEQVVLVTITEEDIQAQKEWPFSDQLFAQLLAQLQQHSPQVIGLDIYRDVPHAPGTEALAAQLQRDNVVTITKLDDLGQNRVPSPHGVPESRVGFNDFVVDSDGVVRRNFMFAALGDRQLHSLSLRLVAKFLAPTGIQVTVERDAIKIGNTRFRRITDHTGGYQSVDSTGYQSILRYFPTEDVGRYLSLSQVLSGSFEPSWIKGKIVLIGTTAPSQKDLFYTPFSRGNRDTLLTAGVVIHAQITRQMLSAVVDTRPLIGGWPGWAEGVWVWVWGLGGALIVWRCNRLRVIVLTATAGLLGLAGLSWLLFSQAVWVPFVLPACTFVSTSAGLVTYKAFRKTFYDSITSLPNRARFTQELQKRLKQQPAQSAAIILLDIDRFKTFNENFGLQAGDCLLQMMARRLQQTLPPTTKVARVVGAEFAILLENFSQAEDVVALATVLSQKMSESISLDAQKLFPTVSIGISFYIAELGISQPLTAEDLMRDAQTAMSRAKLRGRGQCEVFAADMRAQLSDRLWLEADLREAIACQEFVLYYQPLVCLKTMTIAGFEALIRWQHPEKGMIFPGEFIPVAEDTGMIVPIGQWVLEAACQQAQIWRQKFPDRAPFISVNLSSRQFAQQDLVEQIDRILTESGLERSALKLELTESMVMDDVDASIKVLLRLKALQLRLGIDDFGTGYSSLSYLHRFPIDTLKIDRSFITDMEAAGGTAELVKTIIALGHNLGMDVVAEGIETISQSKILQALQCEYGQGYLFAKPLPAQAAETLLTDAHPWAAYEKD
ncbi:MAG: EAL domain-containing protein [Phormidesmis sp.]